MASSPFEGVAERQGTDSASIEPKRRKVYSAEGFAFSAPSVCWCGYLKWNNEMICPKVISQTELFTGEKLEDNLESEKYTTMEKAGGDFLSPGHQSSTTCLVEKAITSDQLDVEKSLTGGFEKHGSLIIDMEKHLARNERLVECQRSLSFITSQGYFKKEHSISNPVVPDIITLDDDLEMDKDTKKENLQSNTAMPEIIDLEDDFKMEKYPKRKYLNSDPAMREIIDLEEDLKMENFFKTKILNSDSAFPVVIDLGEDDEPSDKGTAVQSTKGDKTGTTFQFVPSEEMFPRPIAVVIDSKEDENLDIEKNLCASEAIDSRQLAGNFSENNLEDEGNEEHRRLREGDYCHTGQTEINENEGSIGPNQATHMDDQLMDRNSDERHRPNGETCPAGKPEHKTDNGLIGFHQAFNMDDELTSLGCAEGQKSEGNFCHIGETELQKDEGIIRTTPFHHAEEIALTEDKNVNIVSDGKIGEAKKQTKASSDGVAYVSEVEKNKGEYIGVEDDAEIEEGVTNYAEQGNVWNEMEFALECCKDTFVDYLSDECTDEDVEDCDHSFILKDEIGSVCRVCGLIEKEIASIIEYKFGKRKRSGRTYKHERSRGSGSDDNVVVPDGMKSGEEGCFLFEVPVHPRHQKLMKPHQLEGINFLLSNLVTEHPGGCVMAHAPGSGKTFMVISFLQIFMTKYPNAKPLIVLPRGILSTWRKEFQRWQVEDRPLYDFYSSKAESRSQQLEVLEKWGNGKGSILFLGYKQFTTIVCGNDSSKTTMACRDFLLTCPSILILDEGHTPRNENTDTLRSLEQVQTPRKVVLSGTLYQNHVKEVFNVLNLVRPKFLEMEPPRSIKKRILSKDPLSSGRKEFYDTVERMILDDIKFNRKVNIIQDLREMTSKVLHYYKGDSLDELPGLVDFTVFLELSEKQKRLVEKLKKCKSKFKISSEGSLIYVHPQLNMVSKNSGGRDKVDIEKVEKEIDQILENLEEIGVKAKFYLNLLQLCESNGEKLLVFSQYILPMKLLERLTVKKKEYTVGKEIFVITGDSDSGIRDSSMEKFNTSSDARVFFGSIKACGEGISLVGASRIIILDVHLNPSVTRQAIGRAFRPGQERIVYTYRLVASGSPEEEDHTTCFSKESIAKKWFEWNAYQGKQGFEMKMVDVNDCGDKFLETPRLHDDVVSVCRR